MSYSEHLYKHFNEDNDEIIEKLEKENQRLIHNLEMTIQDYNIQNQNNVEANTRLLELYDLLKKVREIAIDGGDMDGCVYCYKIIKEIDKIITP